LVINVVLYLVGVWAFFRGVQWLLHLMVGQVDRWYDYLLAVTVWVTAPVLFGLLFFFTFVVVVNLLAAPFADVLSEKTEAHLTGKPLNLPFSVKRLLRDIAFGIAHGIKLLLCQCVVLVIGLVPFVGPPIAIVGTALLLSLEFMDYPMTRRRMKFREKRKMTFDAKWLSLGFGFGAMLWLIVPLVNLVCVPAAICGGTALFLDIDRRGANDGD